MKKKAITTTPATPKISAKEATAEKVLNLLLSKLSHGVNAWRKPWDCKGNPTADPRFFAVNLFTGKPYNGINAQTLEAGFYAGFSQITANGGKIKKGSNSYPVVWFGSFEKDLPEQEAEDFFWNVFDVNKSKPASGKYGACYKFAPNFYEVYNVYLDENCDLVKVTKDCKILKAENVFSIEDTEGLESFVEEFWKNFKGKEKSEIFDADEKGDLWIEAYCDGAKLHGFHHDGGNSSYYSPSSDSIHLAKKTAYHSPAEYYSTAFHEMTHSSGAASRLNRDGIVNFDHFGSPRYAKEELIAEMGAAMAMGFLGIDTEATNDNSAAYLGNWLRQKIGEKASEAALKTLMSASSSAKFAFAYIAEFYEAAKTSKEEENKQKKTEEPETLPMLPMLPAIIAPNASATTAAVFKADPAEAKEPTSKERFLFCENVNSITLYDTQKNDEVWKLFLDTCEELEDPKAWDELPEEVKEQARRWAKHYRDAKWDKLQTANLIFLPKQYDAEAYGTELVSTLQGNDLIRTKQKNGTYVDYNLVSFLKRFYIIENGAHYRLMPNGEPDPEHYSDGLIDVRNVQESCTMVFTTREGDTKAVCYDDNFFAPCDLLQAYKALWRSDWNMDDKKALYIKKFKEYLIATGCNAEELEEAE